MTESVPDPLLAGAPVYGIRGWILTYKGFLQSTTWYWNWPGVGPHKAQHLTKDQSGNLDFIEMSEDHNPKTCHVCGFYAYSTLEAALKCSYLADPEMVLGIIMLWGQTAVGPCQKVEATRYRASNAMIVALEKKTAKGPSEEIYPVPRVPRAELALFGACMFEDSSTQGIGT